MTTKCLSRRQFFSLSYFAYASIYIARLNLTIASPVMQKQGLLTLTQIGMMGGAFFLCYSIGQLLNGFLGDALPARHMIASGLFFTAVGNLCIGLLPPAEIILILWGINGFSQSMLWGPLLRMLAENFPDTNHAKTASLLNSSVGTGSILGILIAAAAIYFQDVRYAFFLPGLLSMAAAVSVFLFFPAPALRQCAKKEAALIFSSRLRFLCSPRLLILLLPAMFHGVLKDNLNLWVASYFADAYSLALTELSFYVVIIPLLTLAGRLIYPTVYRLCHNREHTVSIAALTAIALCMIPFCLRGIPVTAAIVCLGITAAAISVTNNSFLSVYPTRYSKCGCVSSVVGLMDFSTYLGAGISSILYGRLLEKGSYSILFVSWFILSILAILFIYIHNHIKKGEIS